MANIIKDFNYCCLVCIDDIFTFPKTVEQHKDNILTITQRSINYSIILGKNKYIYAEEEIKFLGAE